MVDKSALELEEYLKQGKMVQLTPQGISMLPFIRGGVDRVLLHKEEAVGIGDIVLAHHGGRLILHRVYAIEGATFVLMGDGNLKGNERVERHDVLATALERIDAKGRRHKLGKAWLWRHTVPLRKYLLKLYGKWNRLINR